MRPAVIRHGRAVIVGAAVALTVMGTTRMVGAQAQGADGGAEAGAGGDDGGVAPVADAGGQTVDAVASPAAESPAPPALPTVAPPVAPPAGPLRVDELTVVGTRETRTAGSAHIMRPRDLERLRYDNPESIVKTVPGIYARGEDGFGLRPNIGIRGTSPDRSKKVTLMEDGILFGPAPYSAPAAYFFPQATRMESVRIIKGPGAISYGPQTVGGAIDFITRGIPTDETGSIDLSLGNFGYGRAHATYGASTPRSGYVLEGVRLQTSGFKQLDGGGDTGFEHNEWMWKGQYQLSTDLRLQQEVGLKLGYSDEDSRESYLGLTDADARATPLRRYRASMFDRMQWHRTQIVGSYRARWREAFTLDVSVYRHDFSRTWRKVNRMGGAAVADVLADPTSARNAVLYSVLTGAADASSPAETIYVGPNRRLFVAQGIRAVGGWRGSTGPLEHRIEAGARLHYDRIDRLHTEDGFVMTGGELIPDRRPTITTADQRGWTNAWAFHLTAATTWRRLTVTPGARVELISMWLRDRLAGSKVKGSPQRLLLPGVGAFVALTPSLGALAGVYRGFSPAIPAAPGTVLPETSVNTEFGFRFTPRRVRVEAIGFINNYRNLTSVCGSGEGCVTPGADVQTDSGRAHIYGLETFGRAEAAVAPGIVLPFTLAYTFTRTKMLDAGLSDDPSLGMVEPGDELPYVPHHQAHALAGIETERGDFTVAATYVSAAREKAGQGPLVGTERRTAESLIIDTNLRVHIGLAGQVYLGIRNLTNAHDIAARLPFGARPVAPRSIQVGTKWSF